jgi:hypothetical protein
MYACHQPAFAQHVLAIMSYPLKALTLECAGYHRLKGVSLWPPPRTPALPRPTQRLFFGHYGRTAIIAQADAVLGLAVAGTLDGVSLVLKYERGPQKLNVPVRLVSGEPHPQAFCAALAATVRAAPAAPK